MPRAKSRQSDNGTRNASCSFVNTTGVFEIEPSALQYWISVQLVAAGHCTGGNGGGASWSFGTNTGTSLAESGTFGIGSDNSSSPLFGGK